jgi:diadenylate cyclase
LSDRLLQLYEAADSRDAVEIVLLAFALYFLLRLLGRTRGANMVRGFALFLVVFFLVAQVVIVSFDLIVLSKVLDYLLTTVLLGLLIIFQPELRRGLMLLGRYRLMQLLVTQRPESAAEKLAAAAQAMSSECVGALIAFERETSLVPFIETGERLDCELSARLIRSVFSKRSPLHDGAMIISGGRIASAACQLPLGQPPEGAHMGMRHRSAVALSDETDAVLLVVSEETGRISLGLGGRLEVIPHDQLVRRLVDLLGARGRGGSQKPRRKAA